MSISKTMSPYLYPPELRTNVHLCIRSRSHSTGKMILLQSGHIIML